MISYPVRTNSLDESQVMATTPAQGQRLVRAGLDKRTGDMHWLALTYDVDGDIPRERQNVSLFTGPGWRKSCGSDCIPAWSIGALVGIAGGDALREAAEADIDVSSPAKLRAYLVGYILIALSEGLIRTEKPQKTVNNAH